MAVFPPDPLEPVVPDVAHVASALDGRAFYVVSRSCTRVMRVAMKSASLVLPAALALASRASAFGRRAATLPSNVWILVSIFGSREHGDGTVALVPVPEPPGARTHSARQL